MKNLNTILPFYDAITEQYRYREDVDVQPCLTVLNTTLIPWVIRREHSDGTTSNLTIKLYDLDGAEKETISNTLVTITTGTSYDHILYESAAITALSTGARYMVVTDAYPTPDKVYYSETFFVVSSVSTLLKFQFSNTTELSSIPANFVQIAYLNTVLKTPEYIREDTGEKRDGLVVKEKQVVMKSYVLRSIVATEYLIDALMLVPMMDEVKCTTQGGEVMIFDEARIKDPEWNPEALGSRAKVEIQLIKDVVIKKLNFKETGYSGGGGGTSMASLIRSGYGVTVLDDGVYTKSVTFTEAMPDANYTPYAYAYAVNGADVQVPYISNITALGFQITTLVACNVKWSAVKE